MQVPPGPDSMHLMARGFAQGRRVALFTVLGVTVGAGMVQLPLIALGVSSLVRASPFAFTMLQWIGAAYLIWLGLKLIFSSPAAPAQQTTSPVNPFVAAREGMIANLINPWPITFMVAFLPQFVNPHEGSVTLQLLLLGATQKTTGVLVLGTYAVASGSIGSWIMMRPRVRLWQQRIAGCVIVWPWPPNGRWRRGKPLDPQRDVSTGGGPPDSESLLPSSHASGKLASSTRSNSDRWAQRRSARACGLVSPTLASRVVWPRGILSIWPETDSPQVNYVSKRRCVSRSGFFRNTFRR
jgi:threonine/homoserine/homoserine lactone efflux protein